MDPCLDDTIMFAKRLKAINHNVQLQVLDDLPHGFLNFAPVSLEAYRGAYLCIDKLRILMDLDDRQTDIKSFAQMSITESEENAKNNYNTRLQICREPGKN